VSYGESSTDAQRTRKKCRGFDEEKVEREREKVGQLSIAAIAYKSRYFVEGAVLGSKIWVNEG
jgi:hypothetical protein